MSLKIWGTNLRRPNFFIFSIGNIFFLEVQSFGYPDWYQGVWIVLGTCITLQNFQCFTSLVDSPFHPPNLIPQGSCDHHDFCRSLWSCWCTELRLGFGVLHLPKTDKNFPDKLTSQKETGLSNYWGNYDNTSLFGHTLANDFLRNGEQKSPPKQSKAAGKFLFVGTDRKRIRHVLCVRMKTDRNVSCAVFPVFCVKSRMT